MTDEDFLSGIMSAALSTKAQYRKLEPELLPAVPPPPPPPPPPALALYYKPEIMVDLMVNNPSWQPMQFAQHFSRSLSWFSSVLASESFQQALAPRRHEIDDPYLTATMEERFRALALQSLNVLSTKMDAKEVSEFIATKAAEIGVKALGLGNSNAVTVIAAPAASGAEAVAERIMAAMAAAKARTIATDIIDIPSKVIVAPDAS